MTYQLRQIPGLILKPTQIPKLILTPQLRQAINLLQLSRLELHDTINKEMETNPLLEDHFDGNSDETMEYSEENESNDRVDEVTMKESMREDFDRENYLSEYNIRKIESSYKNRDFPSFQKFTATEKSLTSHLTWQLGMSGLTDIQKEIGIHIIGNLDEDGYLRTSVEDIAQSTRYAEEQVAEVLNFIQNFDPVGIVARDVQECLLIQLRSRKMESPVIEKILLDHMDELANRKYAKIARSLSVQLQEVLVALSVIKNLDPKPGRQFISESTIYITPDIYVSKAGDNYAIFLNEDGLPKLRINHYYRQILANGNNLEDCAKEYVLDKLKSAAWLIKSIHQRQRTIYRVTASIFRFQRDFLDHGITHLKPLVLRQIAEQVHLHESTVSRATTNKYVHTPQGIFELKFFFNSAIEKTDGGAVASQSVKEHIRNIVKSENPFKPYGDQEITNILMKMEIRVARRTVAKYRESMGIPSSRQRKNNHVCSIHS